MRRRDAWLQPSKPGQSGFTALADRVLTPCMNSRAEKHDLQMSIDLLATAARSRCPLARPTQRVFRGRFVVMRPRCGPVRAKIDQPQKLGRQTRTRGAPPKSPWAPTRSDEWRRHGDSSDRSRIFAV